MAEHSKGRGGEGASTPAADLRESLHDMRP